MKLPAPQGLDAWLATQEAKVPGIRPGCEKRILWAGEQGKVTDWAVVYVHGFSASGMELAPLPQLVARGLGANLHLTRLDGHGQDGAAMGRATLPHWQKDTAQALAVGATIGRRVLAIGCSTGCTLLTLALGHGADLAGVVMVSPNFALASRMGQAMLDTPFAQAIAPWITGPQMSFPVRSSAHAQGWTTSYPAAALHPMADAVRACRNVALESLCTPALFAFSEVDRVVSPEATHAAMARWGGAVTHRPLVPGAGDDPFGHVMAGDVFSPGQTAPLAAAITAWARAL